MLLRANRAEPVAAGMWLFHLLSRVHGLGCLGALAGAALLVPKLQALSRLLAHEGLLVMEPPPSAALLLGVVDLGPLAASWRLNPTVLSLLQLDDLDERVGAVSTLLPLSPCRPTDAGCGCLRPCWAVGGCWPRRR